MYKELRTCLTEMPSLGDRWGGDNGGLEKATMGFFWQPGGGRESVMNFIFFQRVFIICQASASCWRYSREVTDHSSALLDRYVVINSLQKQKINARNESKKSHSEGMTFELRPEG